MPFVMAQWKTSNPLAFGAAYRDPPAAHPWSASLIRNLFRLTTELCGRGMQSDGSINGPLIGRPGWA